jgi:hypothetical protein
MSNTQYRQKSVRQALNTFYPCPPQGNHSRRLDGLAALINGIVASKSCRLSACASECSGDSKTASRTRNLERVLPISGLIPTPTICPAFFGFWKQHWNVRVA